MKGFHVSTSGAIQGHHGPLVSILVMYSKAGDNSIDFAFLQNINLYADFNGRTVAVTKSDGNSKYPYQVRSIFFDLKYYLGICTCNLGLLFLNKKF